MDFKKAYDSFSMEVLYNIVTECGIHTKLFRQINKTYSEI
jgi:hypothetical protein